MQVSVAPASLTSLPSLCARFSHLVLSCLSFPTNHAVASNGILETCSEGFDVDFSIPPTTPIYRISLANGDSWKLSPDDNLVYTSQGDELQFVIHNSFQATGIWVDSGVQITAVNTGTNKKWLMETRNQFSYQFGTEPLCCDGFQLYRSGNGTYAILSTKDGKYISRNRTSGRIGVGADRWLADPNTVTELFWRITPDPPESLIAGNLTAPSAPVPVSFYTRGATFMANVSCRLILFGRLLRQKLTECSYLFHSGPCRLGAHRLQKRASSASDRANLATHRHLSQATGCNGLGQTGSNNASTDSTPTTHSTIVTSSQTTFSETSVLRRCR